MLQHIMMGHTAPTAILAKFMVKIYFLLSFPIHALHTWENYIAFNQNEECRAVLCSPQPLHFQGFPQQGSGKDSTATS